MSYGTCNHCHGQLGKCECVADTTTAEQFLDGLGEMARLRADAETRAATAEQRVNELECLCDDSIAMASDLNADVTRFGEQVAELLEEHRRSLAVFEQLKKWFDHTGLRTNVELVDASIKATRALIAKAEVTR